MYSDKIFGSMHMECMLAVHLYYLSLFDNNAGNSVIKYFHRVKKKSYIMDSIDKNEKNINR